MKFQALIINIVLSTFFLSACSNGSKNSNTVQVYTYGDLTSIEITDIDANKTWVFDSYQSEPIDLELEQGARLSIKAESDYHDCWFQGWEPEITVNDGTIINITCNKRPLFNVLSSKAPNPISTSLYTFDGHDLQLIKETPSDKAWPEWSSYRLSNKVLFNTEGVLLDGLQTKFDDITEKAIEHAFFDPDLDKNAIFVVASNPNEESELFTLSETLTALQPVNLISDLSVSDFLSENFNPSETILNYHHSFDGINLTSSASFEVPDISNLTNIPNNSGTGLSRIKLKYHDDLFYWFTENGPQVVRRVLNKSGESSLISPVVLPELESLQSIYRINNTRDKVILEFTYGSDEQCKNYYEYDLADNWRLIFNTCDQDNSLSALAGIASNEYFAIDDDPSGWLIIDYGSGDVLEKILPERTYTGSVIYNDGIMFTSSEERDTCYTTGKGCWYVNKIYFYSFELNTIELLLTSDPVKFQPSFPYDHLYHSPIFDLLTTTYTRYNLTYKNLKFFIAYTAETGNEIWQTDGTVEGTKAIETFSPGPQSGVYYHWSGQSLVPVDLNE